MNDLPESCDACVFERYEDAGGYIMSYCSKDKSIKTGSDWHDRMTERHSFCPLEKE